MQNVNIPKIKRYILVRAEPYNSNKFPKVTIRDTTETIPAIISGHKTRIYKPISGIMDYLDAYPVMMRLNKQKENKMNIELADDEVACLRKGNVPASVKYKLRKNVKVELTPRELDFVASIVGVSESSEENIKLLRKFTSLGPWEYINFVNGDGSPIRCYKEVK
jgi:hypothetical protein